MRTLTFTLQALILSLAVGGAFAADVNDAERQLAKQLAAELKAALSAALRISPENAIGVCNERAPAIVKKLSQDQNVQIGRTSLKVRNSNNAPSEWQRGVLLDFQNRLAAGEPLATMEYSTAVQVKGGVEHRYMKAIPV
jgi:hypothetical protein